MGGSDTNRLRIGDWRVDPNAGEISREGVAMRLEARTMRLLLHLADHAGEVVSTDDLLKQVWSGVMVTSDSVYQAVATLRRALGDDPRHPTYIATVPRLGYRLVAPVRPWNEAIDDVAVVPARRSRRPLRAVVGSVVVLGVALVGALWIMSDRRPSDSGASLQVARVPERSIAVLPFLDLTEAMDEEPFADGMTEELINRLTKIPGLRVPSPRSSFYFKGKQLSVTAIAESLGVAYVLDGSVRKSGGRMRVAARLVRAGDGFVSWSESYDRPVDDILMVQDDIAGQVMRSLKTSIEPAPEHE